MTSTSLRDEALKSLQQNVRQKDLQTNKFIIESRSQLAQTSANLKACLEASNATLNLRFKECLANMNDYL
eukprot:Ihof_evm8s235 gene=Ihof_evmTU8s235